MAVFRRVLLDRKSTRLNSSHTIISYAVFCLEKKRDRKSTRLNSSHTIISYAVFCLEKFRSDRKSTRLNPSHDNLVCRLLLAKNKVLAYYDHPLFGRYAAITENRHGKGLATYICCMTSNAITEKILADAVKKAGLWGAAH